MPDFPEHTFPEHDGVIFLEVCPSRDVTSTRGKIIAFDDEDMNVAVFRVGDRLYASSNICPHQHAPMLHDGVIERSNAEAQGDCTITCPLHGWTYSLVSGASTFGSASKLRVYRVFEQDGTVYLEKPEPIEPAWLW